MTNKTIYVDIDETICITPENRDYAQAAPITENIEKINKLYNDNTIIYWTARGSTTGKSWFDVTIKQLDKWGVKYNELRMGKPQYDLFICDKAINTTEFIRQAT